MEKNLVLLKDYINRARAVFFLSRGPFRLKKICTTIKIVTVHSLPNLKYICQDISTKQK